MAITVAPVEPGLVVATADSPPMLQEILTAMDESAAFRAPRRLWDLRVGVRLDRDEVRRIAAHGRYVSGTGRLALLTSDDVSYGTLRMLEVYRNEEGFESSVFREEQAAYEWLRRFPVPPSGASGAQA